MLLKILFDPSQVEIDPWWSLRSVFFAFSLPFQLPCPKLKKTNKKRKEVRKGLVREKHFSFLI